MQLIDLEKDPGEWVHVMEAEGPLDMNAGVYFPGGRVPDVSKYVTNCLASLADSVVATCAVSGTLHVRDRGDVFVLTVENADLLTWRIREVDL